jgi:hypothetical protein
MNLLIAELSSLETDSHVREATPEPATKRLSKGDWWFLELPTFQENASTDGVDPGIEESTKTQSARTSKAVKREW